MRKETVQEGREADAGPESGIARLSAIAERLRAEMADQLGNDAWSDERQLLRSLIDLLPDHLFVKDREGRFVLANSAFAVALGLDSPGQLLGKTDFDVLAQDAAQKVIDDDRHVMQSGQSLIDLEEQIVSKAGASHWFSTNKIPLRDSAGRIVGLVGLCRNITDRKKNELLQAEEGHILEMIATNSPLDKVLDKLARIVEARLEGIIASILLLDGEGRCLRHGAAPNLPHSYISAIDGTAIGPKAGSCGTAAWRRRPVIVADIGSDPLWDDFRHLTQPIGLRSCWSTPIMSHQGAVLGTFAMYSRELREPDQLEIRLVDMATRIAGLAIERQRAEERIYHMVHHDALTGLPNRILLMDRLDRAILNAQRSERSVTVAFIDLDNFKVINDSLGHGCGDELLKVMAERMVGCVRNSDTVVRLGGDEFVILLTNQSPSTGRSAELVAKLQTRITEPVSIDGHLLQITCSMGLATYPKDGADASTLLMNADAAMYRAKELGRNNYQFCTAWLSTKNQEKLALQEGLRNALARGEFVLFYQPQVDLKTRRIFAVEALIRWQHPHLGLVSPSKFIPVAEETGLIAPIGDWALKTACRQNKAWQDNGAPPVTMSVNVSARQFMDRHWVTRVAQALQESRLEAQYLELELTESLIMRDVKQAIATMRDLRAMNVQLSIDDFGTGYSSLNALKTFPVARLKLDSSFVRDIPFHSDDNAIAIAVISLGHQLGLKVIAEGVETAEQLQFLAANECDEFQGYYFSKPVPAGEVEALLRKA